MPKTPFVLARVTASGVDPFYCDGLKVTDEYAIDPEHHGGSHDRMSVTWKKRKIDFELLAPRDHMSLNQLIYRCRDGYDFTITAFGEDDKGVFRALERLTGCILPSRERTVGNFDAVKMVLKGSADDAQPIQTTFD